MKILLLSPLPPPEGGIASWTEQYLVYFEESNIEISLVNTALVGERRKQINNRTRLSDEIKRTKNILLLTERMLKKNRYDIVHINSSCSKLGIIRDYFCALTAKKHGVPVVLHCHCNVEDQIQGSGSITVLRRLCSVSSAVIVLNTKSRSYIEKLGPCKIFVLPNFIDKTFLAPTHNIRKKIEKAVFIGHVQPSKGSREIMEAAKQFPDIAFELVGPVHEALQHADVPGNVFLLGRKEHDSIEKYLSEADIFVFPSYTEGFSVSLLEAMANGLPCIATDVGANADMLENSGGIIIPSEDACSLTAAIHGVEDPALRSQMSQWNIEKVKRSFLTETVMARLISIYEETAE